MSRETKKRSSSLPESRASSGMDLLTDQLVSSILGEVTGGPSNGPQPLPRSHAMKRDSVPRELKIHDTTSSAMPTAASADNSNIPANNFPFRIDEELSEEIVIKMASIQTLACQALVEFFNHTPIHNIETEMGDICNLVIGNALKEIQLKIDETEMKAKAFKPHFKVLAMISIGLARRSYLDRLNSPIQPPQPQQR